MTDTWLACTSIPVKRFWPGYDKIIWGNFGSAEDAIAYIFSVRRHPTDSLNGEWEIYYEHWPLQLSGIGYPWRFDTCVGIWSAKKGYDKYGKVKLGTVT